MLAKEIIPILIEKYGILNRMEDELEQRRDECEKETDNPDYPNANHNKSDKIHVLFREMIQITEKLIELLENDEDSLWRDDLPEFLLLTEEEIRARYIGVSEV